MFLLAFTSLCQSVTVFADEDTAVLDVIVRGNFFQRSLITVITNLKKLYGYVRHVFRELQLTWEVRYS